MKSPTMLANGGGNTIIIYVILYPCILGFINNYEFVVWDTQYTHKYYYSILCMKTVLLLSWNKPTILSCYCLLMLIPLK